MKDHLTGDRIATAECRCISLHDRYFIDDNGMVAVNDIAVIKLGPWEFTKLRKNDTNIKAVAKLPESSNEAIHGPLKTQGFGKRKVGSSNWEPIIGHHKHFIRTFRHWNFGGCEH